MSTKLDISWSRFSMVFIVRKILKMTIYANIFFLQKHADFEITNFKHK